MGLIITKDGQPASQQQEDFRAEPGVIVLHCAWQPETGRVGMFASKRNVEPKSLEEVKVQLDNHFTTLANCMGLMISHLMKNGMDRQKLQDVLLHVINRVVEGGNDGQREKIVVENYDKKIDETLGKLDFDEELHSLGYKKLTSEPWLKMLANPSFDKFKEQESCPKDLALINSIVFRKNINQFTILEISRPEAFLRRSAKPNENQYSASLVHQEDGVIKRGTWFFEDTDNFAQKIADIEADAVKISEVYAKQVDLRPKIATGRIFETDDFWAKESMSTTVLKERLDELTRKLDFSVDVARDMAECRWIALILAHRVEAAANTKPKQSLLDKFLSFFK